MTPQPDAPALQPLAGICAAAIAVAFAVGWWNAGFIKEDGALELAAVVTLILVAVIHTLRLPSLAFGPEWHLPVLASLLAMRELDFDKRFMETGVLKLRLYTGDAPLMAKLIGATVITLVIACLYRLVRHNARSYLAALRVREGWARLIAFAILAVVVAKSIDGLARKLAPFGIELNAALGPFIITLEEALEFGFGVALLSSVFLWIRRYA